MHVVAVGYAGEVLLGGRRLLHVLPDGIGREDLSLLAEIVSYEVADAGTVLAIYPAWAAEPALQRLQTVRSALASSHLVVRPSELPPLAGSALCAMAAALAPLAPSPAALIAGLPAMERQILAIARLPSVANLRRPSPSLGQHLLSWWPPSAFGVSWWPQVRVRRLRKSDPGVPLPGGSMWSGVPLRQATITAGDSHARSWFDQFVFPVLGTEEVVEVEAAPAQERYWGTRGAMEAVAYPTDLGALRSHVFDGVYAVRCTWCGESTSSDVCPFCGSDRAAPALDGGAA